MSLHTRKDLSMGIDYSLTDGHLTAITPEAEGTIKRLLEVPVFPFMHHFCSMESDGSVIFTDKSVTHFVPTALSNHAPFVND